MRKDQFLVTATMSLLLCQIAVAAKCGGGGPQPFESLTGKFNPTVSTFGVVGPLQEFIYWEKSNALVYHNTFQQLRILALQDMIDVYYQPLRLPLSRLVDDEERYVLTEKGYMLLDTKGGKTWTKIWPSEHSTPSYLFWYHRNLYLLDESTGPAGGQVLNVYRYDATNGSLNRQCTHVAPFKNPLQLASGHVHPNVFVYRMNDTKDGRVMSFGKMDIKTCNVTEISATEPLPGNPTRVYRFDAQDSFVVGMDNSDKNLRWEFPNGCYYHHVDNPDFMVPNPSRPLVVTWTPDSGVGLYNLGDTKMAAILKGQKRINKIEEKDLWLPRNQNDLLVSSYCQDESQRYMMEIPLDEFMR